jgi:hypothetical protein
MMKVKIIPGRQIAGFCGIIEEGVQEMVGQ